MRRNQRKLAAILIIGAVLSTFNACGKTSNERLESESTMNDVISIFDESFFDNAKAISLVEKDLTIEDEKIINEIKQLIINVPHTESDKNIYDYYGPTILTLTYSDGSSKTISLTSDLILDGGNTFALNEDICSEIIDLFYTE